jgi:hypothetical protein
MQSIKDAKYQNGQNSMAVENNYEDFLNVLI